MKSFGLECHELSYSEFLSMKKRKKGILVLVTSSLSENSKFTKEIESSLVMMAKYSELKILHLSSFRPPFSYNNGIFKKDSYTLLQLPVDWSDLQQTISQMIDNKRVHYE